MKSKWTGATGAYRMASPYGPLLHKGLSMQETDAQKAFEERMKIVDKEQLASPAGTAVYSLREKLI